MYGLTWKVKGYKMTKHFMSQEGLNKFIALLKLNSLNTDIQVMKNERSRWL